MMPNLGAVYSPDHSSVTFTLWSPQATRVELWIYSAPMGTDAISKAAMTKEADGDLLPKIRTRLSMISYLRKGEFMSRSNHTEAQMIGALKQLEAGRKAEDVAREVGVSKHTIYAWKAKYGGMDVSEAQEAKQLRDENTRLKKLVVDLSLDKEMLKAIIAKNGWSS